MFDSQVCQWVMEFWVLSSFIVVSLPQWNFKTYWVKCSWMMENIFRKKVWVDLGHCSVIWLMDFLLCLNGDSGMVVRVWMNVDKSRYVFLSSLGTALHDSTTLSARWTCFLAGVLSLHNMTGIEQDWILDLPLHIEPEVNISPCPHLRLRL